MEKIYQKIYQNLRSKAFKLGATEFGKSKVNDKKFYVIYRGKRINFGAKNMSDYTIHNDPERRRRYRARHGAIRNPTSL